MEKAKTNENTNLALFKKLEQVPEEAKTKIIEGRLKGKNSINTMWRIKKLTEVLGPCGIGWNFRVTDTRILEIASGAKAIFLDIAFKFKDPATGQWSEDIHGTGGNTLVRSESKGLYLNDDAYKMALSDAISSAARLIGLGGNVYYENDPENKYVPQVNEQQVTQQPQATPVGVQPVFANKGQQKAKPELNKLHPKWSYSIATIAASNSSNEELRRLIENMYTITDANFAELLRLAGRTNAS